MNVSSSSYDMHVSSSDNTGLSIDRSGGSREYKPSAFTISIFLTGSEQTKPYGSNGCSFATEYELSIPMP